MQRQWLAAVSGHSSREPHSHHGELINVGGNGDLIRRRVMVRTGPIWTDMWSTGWFLRLLLRSSCWIVQFTCQNSRRASGDLNFFTVPFLLMHYIIRPLDHGIDWNSSGRLWLHRYSLAVDRRTVAKARHGVESFRSFKFRAT